MALTSWSFTPPEQVQPGRVSFGWSLASSDVRVRWYLEPLQADYPASFQANVRSTTYPNLQAGLYIFHLESQDSQGNVEERVVLFEVVQDVEEETQEILLTTLPAVREIRPLRTSPRNVPFRARPSSHEMNVWMENVVEDLGELHRSTSDLRSEVEMRARVSFLEQVAQEARAQELMLALSARNAEPSVRTLRLKAADFLPGVPEESGESIPPAQVDMVYGEIAPALIGTPENKIGWPTDRGLRLPSSLSIVVEPQVGAFLQTDPIYAIDGRPETAWMREVQVAHGEIPEDIVYRMQLPSGVTSERMANRIDLACLPAFGVDLRSVRVFDGTSWSIAKGWPMTPTATGSLAMPVRGAAAYRLRFPETVIAGVEITLRPKFSRYEEGLGRTAAGLYHLGVMQDAIGWGQRSAVHSIVDPNRLPATGIILEGAAPVFAYGDQEGHVRIRTYRVSPSGAWSELEPGGVLLGEGLGVVVEMDPSADAGWNTVMTGVQISYKTLT